MKPTPTPFPVGTPMFTMPTSMSLWGSTDWAVQSWNLLGNGRTIIQALFLVAAVIAVVFQVVRFARDFTKKDSEE